MEKEESKNEMSKSEKTLNIVSNLLNFVEGLGILSYKALLLVASLVIVNNIGGRTDTGIIILGILGMMGLVLNYIGKENY